MGRGPVTRRSMPSSPRGSDPAVSKRPSPRISTLLVDDHELVRRGIAALLGAEDDIEVVGEARDGRHGLELALRLRPDVVVLDVAMAVLNGVEAARQILQALPKARILILSAHSDEEYVDRATELGVAGYVLKQSSLEDLATAIRTVVSGGSYFSPALSRPKHGRVGGAATAGASAPKEARAQLTSREAEILQRVAEGRANKQVAAELGISIKTVEKHRQSLMKKLGIHDTAGLTRHAIAIGSIEGRDRPSTG